MASTTVSAKRCVNCNTDVTTSKRMKDSSGRYWCVTCGTADQKKKMATAGEPCADCGERFPAAKLNKFGASKLCSNCARQRQKGPGLIASIRASGGGSGGGEMDKARMVKMVSFMGLLAVIAVWRYISAHSN